MDEQSQSRPTQITGNGQGGLLFCSGPRPEVMSKNVIKLLKSSWSGYNCQKIVNWKRCFWWAFQYLKSPNFSHKFFVDIFDPFSDIVRPCRVIDIFVLPKQKILKIWNNFRHFTYIKSVVPNSGSLFRYVLLLSMFSQKRRWKYVFFMWLRWLVYFGVCDYLLIVDDAEPRFDSSISQNSLPDR